MSYRETAKKILKSGISISGAVARSVIGIGAAVLLLFSLKKKKAK
jgi:hypothetical protein